MAAELAAGSKNDKGLAAELAASEARIRGGMSGATSVSAGCAK